MQHFPPTLVLNADFRPLSYYPLSTWGMEQTMYQLFKGRIDVIEEYDIEIRSPSTSLYLPSVVALKEYKTTKKLVSFTRFNVFLRDGFSCQYCGGKFHPKDLTFDHVTPRCEGGITSWDNVVAACQICNALKSNKSLMKPFVAPYKPNIYQLQEAGRRYPPKYLHESWMDYLYWDVPLEET